MILVTFQAKMLHAFGHAFGLAILCFVMLLTQYAPNVALIFLSHSNVAGIFSGTKQGGRVFRIAGRYSIFRPYRLVRYGIDNLGPNNTVSKTVIKVTSETVDLHEGRRLFRGCAIKALIYEQGYSFRTSVKTFPLKLITERLTLSSEDFWPASTGRL